MKLIELQVLGGAKIGKFDQASLCIRRYGEDRSAVKISGLPVNATFGDPNGIYVQSDQSERWEMTVNGVKFQLLATAQGSSEPNSWGIFASGTTAQYIAQSQTVSSISFPWVDWPEVCSKIIGSTNRFDLACGTQKLSMTDEKLVFSSPPNAGALPFTAASLSGNFLTINHSAGKKFVTGFACTIWPKSVSYVSESQLQLDFTGVEISGTQYIWFDGSEGTSII